MKKQSLDIVDSVLTERVTLTYEYALGEVAGRFMEGLKSRRILATRCSKSGMVYLPPRAFCERSFEKCDSWVDAALAGVIEASTIVVRGFEGSRPPPIAVAFVRLDGIDSAIVNYVEGIDLSDINAAMQAIRPGTRVKVQFIPEPQGRITDFYFIPADPA
jgi:uncharacterized OB-fold protein